jgi:hypothetical protein
LISAVESKPTLRLYEPHLAPRSNVTGFVIKKNSARISNRKTPTPLRISELLPGSNYYFLAKTVERVKLSPNTVTSSLAMSSSKICGNGRLVDAYALKQLDEEARKKFERIYLRSPQRGRTPGLLKPCSYLKSARSG